MSKQNHNNWRQGKFIDSIQYRQVSQSQKEEWQRQEEHLVRPSAKGNAICHCSDPEDAKWIAERLNLASELERKNIQLAEEKQNDNQQTKVSIFEHFDTWAASDKRTVVQKNCVSMFLIWLKKTNRL